VVGQVRTGNRVRGVGGLLLGKQAYRGGGEKVGRGHSWGGLVRERNEESWAARGK
jgi:hypothetical protein